MTLLIAAATEKAIFQSCDYRLTSTGRVVSDESAKMITLQYGDWFGLVTYTGLGRALGQDTAAFLVGWLKGNANLTIEEALETIKERAKGFIKAHSPGQRHTFLLTAFNHNEPVVATVSNFEDLDGRYDNAAAEEFSISIRRGRNVPSVVIAGMRVAVDRNDLKLLRNKVRNRGDHPNEVRQLLREINRRASASAKASHMISPECSTISFRGDGQGQLQPDGAAETLSILHGAYMDMRKILKEIGLEGAQFRGASFARFGERLPFPPCTPSIAEGKPAGSFKLQEILVEGWARCTVAAATDSGLLVGNGGPEANPAAHGIWVKMQDGKIGCWDEPARAAGMNKDGLIAATIVRDDNSGCAAVISLASGEKTILPSRFEGGDGEARSVNSNGNVAGRVTIDPIRREQKFYRPAAWIGGDLHVLDDGSFEWGYAIGITDDDEVIAAVYSGHTVSAVRWGPSIRKVVSVGQQGVIPLHVNGTGLVLGAGQDRKGNKVCATASRGQEWAAVGLAAGMYGTAVNDSGDIIGYAEAPDVLKPWALLKDKLAWLPYYRGHSSQPSWITNGGIIVGSAGADHGSHAVVWTKI